MELSLDENDRTGVVEFVKKCREEYDRLLDEAPDIPAISIAAFNLEFPDRDNKPDVCNGLSIIMSDDTHSELASRRAITRWLGAFKAVTRRSRDMDDLVRVESV